jgi:hypothetical protein
MWPAGSRRSGRAPGRIGRWCGRRRRGRLDELGFRGACNTGFAFVDGTQDSTSSLHPSCISVLSTHPPTSQQTSRPTPPHQTAPGAPRGSPPPPPPLRSAPRPRTPPCATPTNPDQARTRRPAACGQWCGRQRRRAGGARDRTRRRGRAWGRCFVVGVLLLLSMECCVCE